MKKPTRESLHRRRVIIIADLLSKVEAEDWHGTADAAMDLREVGSGSVWFQPSPCLARFLSKCALACGSLGDAFIEQMERP